MPEPVIIHAATLEEAHDAILRQFTTEPTEPAPLVQDEAGNIVGIDWQQAIKGGWPL